MFQMSEPSSYSRRFRYRCPGNFRSDSILRVPPCPPRNRRSVPLPRVEPLECRMTLVLANNALAPLGPGRHWLRRRRSAHWAPDARRPAHPHHSGHRQYRSIRPSRFVHRASLPVTCLRSAQVVAAPEQPTENPLRIAIRPILPNASKGGCHTLPWKHFPSPASPRPCDGCGRWRIDDSRESLIHRSKPYVLFCREAPTNLAGSAG